MLQQSRTYAELCYITMIMTIVFYLDKYWYCKLTPNHKALVYYECSENDDILPDQQEKKRENLHFFLVCTFIKKAVSNYLNIFSKHHMRHVQTSLAHLSH